MPGAPLSALESSRVQACNSLNSKVQLQPVWQSAGLTFPCSGSVLIYNIYNTYKLN